MDAELIFWIGALLIALVILFVGLYKSRDNLYMSDEWMESIK